MALPNEKRIMRICVIRGAFCHRLLVLFAGLAWAAVAGAAPAAGEPATPQSLCGGQLRVLVPQGWEVVPVGDSGALLRSELEALSPVEIVLWDIPTGGEASAVAAAMAQETTLFRRAPYLRSGLDEFVTVGGDRGVFVTGQVKTAEEGLRDCAFMAFAAHGKYCVVGTFAPTGAAKGLLNGPLGQIARSLQFRSPSAVPEPGPVVAVVPPAPAPPEPAPPAPEPAAEPEPPEAEPAVTPAPTLPAPPIVADPVPPVQLAPETGDVIPPPAPEPLKLVTYESPLGFRLQHPEGWTVSLVDAHIEVNAAAGDGSSTPAATALIWPMAGLEDPDPVRLARNLLRRWELASIGVEGLLARRQDDLTVLAGTVGTGLASRRLVASCHVTGSSGLLTAIAARPDEFSQHLPALIAILDSFSAGPWWTARPSPGGATVVWHDQAHGIIQVPVPAGWKVKGGVQSFNGTWSIFLEMASADERRLTANWQQPVIPLFRELTPVLRNLGWQEGDKYLANPGDQQLRIMSRQSPQDFLTRHWLATGPQRLENAVIDRLEVRPQVASLLAGDNAAGVAATVHGDSAGQPRQRYCLIATADAPVRIGPNCWQAAVLQCEAPAGALEEALNVLREVVAGARVAPGALPGPATAVSELIAGAQEAVGALPPRREEAFAVRDVLAGLNTRGQGDLWLLSPAALEPWQRAGRRLQQSGSPGDVVPELRPDFWK
jgi:hypothetical protein